MRKIPHTQIKACSCVVLRVFFAVCYGANTAALTMNTHSALWAIHHFVISKWQLLHFGSDYSASLTQVQQPPQTVAGATGSQGKEVHYTWVYLTPRQDNPT